MSYVCQLLPDLDQARLLREAMLISLGTSERRPLTEGEQDALWALVTKLSADIRKKQAQP